MNLLQKLELMKSSMCRTFTENAMDTDPTTATHPTHWSLDGSACAHGVIAVNIHCHASIIRPKLDRGSYVVDSFQKHISPHGSSCFDLI